MVYTITLHLQFLCLVGYLKRSDDTPKLNIHKYNNYNIIEIYINRLSNGLIFHSNGLLDPDVGEVPSL